MLAPSYQVIAVLFGIGVTLHNLEEALFMIDWARSHVKLWFEPNHKMPHLIASLVKHSYSPGAGTGMLFNLPLGGWLIRHHLASAVSPGQVWRSAVFYALLLVVGTLGSLYAAHAIAAAKKV